MLVVHATRALRDRMPTARATSDDVSATALGAWYATRLPWRRAAVLLVNHTTLLPLLMPLAPAATLLARVPDAITELLHHHTPLRGARHRPDDAGPAPFTPHDFAARLAHAPASAEQAGLDGVLVTRG